MHSHASAAPQRRSPLTLVLLLLFVASALIAGGAYVRAVVETDFSDADSVRNARAHVNDMLRQQLDEETGVRGYAASRLRILLQSFYGGRANLPKAFRRVRRDLETLNVPQALPTLRDAEITNYRWLHEVAYPLIEHKRSPATLELRGKVLVDHFRLDVATIYDALVRRTATINARGKRDLVFVGTFVAAAVALLVLGSLFFGIRQHALLLRLERQRSEAEEDRRTFAEARVAYDSEKRISETMQDALAQRDFPELPTMSFSATYIPASEEARIGGDWYDALMLPEGRVLLAVGDVTGHGIDSVVAMNRARQLLTQSALLGPDPAAILQRANEELIRSKSPIVTAASGIVDPYTFEFGYAVAGHPPPILFEPGRGARLLKCGSLPLGISNDVEYKTNTVWTTAGSMIVLYTDGVTEYSRNVIAGEAALLRAVERAATVPRGQAARAIRETMFRSAEIADDVAILTIRLWGAAVRAPLKPRVEITTSVES